MRWRVDVRGVELVGAWGLEDLPPVFELGFGYLEGRRGVGQRSRLDSLPLLCLVTVQMTSVGWAVWSRADAINAAG